MTTLEDLLNIQWNHDQRMVKHCLTRCLYVQSGDTFINVGGSKPGIDRDMWYDDETDGPDASKFSAFRNYNLRINAPTTLRQRYGDTLGHSRVVVLAPNYTRGSSLLLSVGTQYHDEPLRDGARLATDAELAEIEKALAATRKDYEKRLTIYWKRYSKKVHASGYYANR